MIARLPLRARLVAGFSLATLVVLLAAGGFVYWRVEYALDRGIDTELAQASATIAPLVGTSGVVFDRDSAEATGVAWQVVSADGTVLDHGGPAGTRAMLDPGRGTTTRTVNVGDLLPAARQPYRVRVSSAAGPAGAHLLVGVRRDHRDEALRELLLQLALAGLGTLLVTAFVGDRLARAALRPVERYRQQAAGIAAGATELRLDVPPDRDDEVTRLGHTFNEMLAALERALVRERQFVDEASHELRTPITLLTGRIQLARRRQRTAQEHERILGELEIDLDRLARLADQLLRLGAVASAAGHGDLAASAARVVDLRRLADPARAGDLVLEVPADAVPVGVDDFELDRVLGNLLDNAAAHGAAPYRVVVDVPADGTARLLLSDAGPGMTPELLHSATQRFARSEDARGRPGAGLGLALVEAIVVRSGGELRLCHDGTHARHGAPFPIACTHGPELTVTVLLPVVLAP